MQRSKFPYTARSSALVIRHAVSIDERRSKFRQDLIGETKNRSLSRKHHGRHGKHLDDMRRNHLGVPHEGTERPQEDGPKEEETPSPRYRRPSHAQQANRRQRSVSPARSLGAVTEEDGHSMTASSVSLPLRSRSGHADGEEEDDDDDADEALPQDIQEMWFPGCHAVCDTLDNLTLHKRFLSMSFSSPRFIPPFAQRPEQPLTLTQKIHFYMMQSTNDKIGHWWWMAVVTR